MTKTNRSLLIIGSIVITLVYGYFVVFFFGDTSDYFETFSWSFVLLLPYALGATGNYFLLREREFGWFLALILPWAYCLGLFLLVAIFSFGLLFCFVVGVPFLFPAASLGGITMWLLKKYPKAATLVLCLTMFSPFLAAPVEAQFDVPIATTVTHSFVDIDADAETIWNNITTVPTITDDEYRSNWLTWIAKLRPISAELSYEGVGGVREATFANGLHFDEQITVWQPNQQLSFTIVESSGTLLPAPLDLIDGEYFDVQEGSYMLEPLENGRIRLHLTNEHALTSRFNTYGSWWTDRIMRDFQSYILEIVKTRAEGMVSE